MTSRDRVCAALRHTVPDRVPRDLGGTESSGITAIAYNRLRRYLGLPPGKTEVFDVYQQVVKVEDDVRERFGIDTVPLLFEPRRWKEFDLPDGSRCRIPEKWNPVEEEGGLAVRDERGRTIARLPEGGYYFEPVYFPLAHVETPADLDACADEIESCDLPFYADETLDALEERARRLHEETDYAIVGNLLLHLLAGAQLLRGYDVFLVDLLLRKDLAHALLERLLDAYIRRAKAYLARVGRYIQVVLVNDDLGMQEGPLLSPACYREMILPYQKKLFSFIKSRTDAFLLLHSCGSVYRFIPDFIEAGVDALNPVQVGAAGMDSERLKREFGKDITFWGGGCDTQSVLCTASPAEVKQEVKRRVEDFAPGGGFVFTQVHNIQPEVPPENIAAMYEALDEM